MVNQTDNKFCSWFLQVHHASDLGGQNHLMLSHFIRNDFVNENLDFYGGDIVICGFFKHNNSILT